LKSVEGVLELYYVSSSMTVKSRASASFAPCHIRFWYITYQSPRARNARSAGSQHLRVFGSGGSKGDNANRSGAVCCALPFEQNSKSRRPTAQRRAEQNVVSVKPRITQALFSARSVLTASAASWTLVLSGGFSAKPKM
jgi:hypothetical protein